MMQTAGSMLASVHLPPACTLESGQSHQLHAGLQLNQESIH